MISSVFITHKKTTATQKISSVSEKLVYRVRGSGVDNRNVPGTSLSAYASRSGSSWNPACSSISTEVWTAWNGSGLESKKCMACLARGKSWADDLASGGMLLLLVNPSVFPGKKHTTKNNAEPTRKHLELAIFSMQSSSDDAFALSLSERQITEVSRI